METVVSVWALTSGAAQGEVWRLWTGHIAHYGWMHFALNALAAAPALAMVPARDRRLLLIPAFVAAPLISCVILMSPFGFEYRGASALVVGLWFYAGIRERSRRGNIMLALASIKVILEMTSPLRLGMIAVAPLPVAHLAGGIAGIVTAVFSRLQTRRAANRPPEVLDIVRAREQAPRLAFGLEVLDRLIQPAVQRRIERERALQSERRAIDVACTRRRPRSSYRTNLARGSRTWSSQC
jgi:membrane associated rhomboid family serine protease